MKILTLGRISNPNFGLFEVSNFKSGERAYFEVSKRTFQKTGFLLKSYFIVHVDNMLVIRAAEAPILDISDCKTIFKIFQDYKPRSTGPSDSKGNKIAVCCDSCFKLAYREPVRTYTYTLTYTVESKLNRTI